MSKAVVMNAGRRGFHPLRLLVVLCLLTCMGQSVADQKPKDDDKGPIPTLAEKTAGMARHEGYFPFYWDERTGRIWLEISLFDEEFLFVNALRSGVGSNAIGLDRGQIGSSRIVRFVRVGPRVLLWQRNLRFRALSDDPEENRAVEESFAQSILWGAHIEAQSDGAALVDATDLLLNDRNAVASRLMESGQGEFKLEPSRCAVFLARTRNFPKNTELEAILTFTCDKPGTLVRKTAPTAQAIMVRQHLSFIKLPDAGYRPRRFDPRAASFDISFADYASPIDQPLEKRYIVRHRLEKKNPGWAVSEPVEPIVYYVDPGAPEPVRTALIEGARWWIAAFEAAGFKDAFRVEVLPAAADPLDIRYNVIQWVHRSTRGWSYGETVTDPRTGEILKGHVSLGSLRVRQDRLLFEGLEPLFERSGSRWGFCGLTGIAEEASLAGLDPKLSAVKVALARIRQLSAHEVGHTLGFAHNFAASTWDRASVMDYPAPLVKITPAGELDLSDAYGVGTGPWDHWAVRYAYSQFPPGTVESEALDALIQEAIDGNMRFLTDEDARPQGAAHPLASLWDNGADPVDALEHELEVRRIALHRFGEKNIAAGQPLSTLEEALMPVYLHHRYQVAATAKLLGGAYYTYAMRGDGQEPLRWVSAQEQRRALDALLDSIDPEALTLPQELVRLLPPPAFGYSQEGERFAKKTSMLFDPLSAARVAAQLSVDSLLQPERAARLEANHARDLRSPGFAEIVDALLQRTWRAGTPANSGQAAVARSVERVVLEQLLELAGDARAAGDVRAIAVAKLRDLEAHLKSPGHKESLNERAHRELALDDLARFFSRPGPAAEDPPRLQIPPGSPIGD